MINSYIPITVLYTHVNLVILVLLSAFLFLPLLFLMDVTKRKPEERAFISTTIIQQLPCINNENMDIILTASSNCGNDK